ncbi:hypothetical protein O9929_18045 [Vibrio lentus]|nr:hypothetical protein [Vibrio lentus]
MQGTNNNWSTTNGYHLPLMTGLVDVSDLDIDVSRTVYLHMVQLD